jgi:hypothetical protein
MGTKHIDNLDAENSLVLNKVAPSGSSIPNARANELRVFVGTDLALYSRDESGVVRALGDGTSDQTARDAAAAAQATADAALPAVAAAADVNVAGTAIAAALGGKLNTSTLDTDGTMAANSDTRVASQKATRTYIASVLAGVAKNQGVIDCSTEPNYPAASNGDFYRCSVAGKIGGASGTVVEILDLILCVADNAGGTQASVGASWIVGQANITGITAAGLAMLQAADATAQAALLDSFFLAIGAQAADVDPAGTDIAAALGGKLDTTAQAADVDPNGSAISSALSGKLDTSAQAADVDPNGSSISSALGNKLDTSAQAADVDPNGSAISSALGNKLDTTAQAADVDPNGSAISSALGGKLDTSAQASDVDPNGSSISSALGGKLDTSAQAADVDPNGSAISSALGNKLDTTAQAADVDPAGTDIAAALGGKLPLAGGTMNENAIVTLFTGSKWQQSTPDKGIAGTAGFSIICSAGYEYKFALGYLFILSDGSSTVRKVLYAPVAPTTAEDTTLGYTTDTTWEMADGTQYRCTDAANPAVWELVTSVGEAPSDGCSYGRMDAAWVKLRNSAILTTLFATNVTSVAGWTVTGDTPILSDTDVGFISPGSVTAIDLTDDFAAGATLDFSALTGLTSIGYSAFSGQTNLTGALTLPAALTDIYASAFDGCTGITSLTLGASVTTLGNYAFNGCTGLTALSIPNNVTTLGTYAFQNCTGLTSLTIGTGIATLDTGTFQGCTGITSVTIPNTVTSIGTSAFQSCTGLTSVTIGTGITPIPASAFAYCSGLTSVTIPANVTTLGNSAFRDCTGLTSVTIPNTVTSLSSAAFYNCTGLTSVTIGTGITTIPSSTFRNCTGLTSITIPANVTTIGYFAFHSCTGLTSLTIPDTVTAFTGTGATFSTFSGCTGLTSLTIGTGITTIPNSAFNGCTGLTSVTIPANVTTLGNNVFSYCSGLTSITIPNTVTSIGTSAFSSCTSLTTVNAYVELSVLNVTNSLASSGVTDIHARASDGTWTAGGGQTIGGKTGITVTKDL